MIPRFVRSAAILLLTIVSSLLVVAAGLVTRSERLPAAIMEWWGRSFVRLGGWKVRIEGSSYLPAGGAILVVNHQSLVDIPLLLYAFPRGVRFLAKRELGRIPLFGRSMAMAGNLFVDRDDPRDAVHVVREASGRLREGQLLVVFPEGTRSTDGSVGEFRPGAFYLAKKSGAPVVPVAIDGGRRALPRGSLLFRPAEMTVRILPPLPRVEGARLSREEMAGEARRRIKAAREEDKARSSDAGV